MLEEGLSAAYDGLAILAPSFFATCPPAQTSFTVGCERVNHLFAK